MAQTLVTKDPNEVVDYKWFPPLDEGDTITGSPSVVRVIGTATEIHTNDTTSVTLFLSGGIDGETSGFELRATTVGGRVWEEVLYLPVATSAYASLAVRLVQVHSQFSTVPASQIRYWLERAALVVTWGDDHDTMLAACHYMVVNGLGTSSQAEIMGQGLAGVSSIRTGALSVNFGDKDKSSETGWQSTQYGRQLWPSIYANRGTLLVGSTGRAIYEGDDRWAY